jgi:hypothetical protein
MNWWRPLSPTDLKLVGNPTSVKFDENFHSFLMLASLNRKNGHVGSDSFNIDSKAQKTIVQ